MLKNLALLILTQAHLLGRRLTIEQYAFMVHHFDTPQRWSSAMQAARKFHSRWPALATFLANQLVTEPAEPLQWPTIDAI